LSREGKVMVEMISKVMSKIFKVMNLEFKISALPSLALASSALVVSS
jgi:hypothetical protein